MDRLKYVEENMLLKTLSGSRAYGMALPGSDWDYRGVFGGSRMHIITPFAESLDHSRGEGEDDTMFYELSKFIKLVIDQNPNVLEFLWVDPEDIIQMSSIWQPLQAARNDLLTSRLLHTYTGYAMQQISHMRSHEKWINNPKPKQAPKPSSYMSVVHNIGLGKAYNNVLPKQGEWTAVGCGNDTYLLFEGGNGSWFDSHGNLRSSTREEAGDKLHQVPSAIFKFNRNEYEKDKKDHSAYWSWVENRNKSRSAQEAILGYDTKNASHLLRLMYTCVEALQEKIIRVRRPNAQELLDVRAGSLTYDQVMSRAKELEDKAREAAIHTTLPKTVDRKKISTIINKMYEEFWRKQESSFHPVKLAQKSGCFPNGAPDVRERVVVIDCEATGHSTSEGGGIIVEIGAVEIVGGMKTGRVFHAYVNPENKVSDFAIKVHGLSDKFLSDKPLFSQVAQNFLDFCGDSIKVMHDAHSDTHMLDYELKRIGRDVLDRERIVCSKKLARNLYPGFDMSLNTLCDVIGIDRSNRTKHGALIDADILGSCLLTMSNDPSYQTAKHIVTWKKVKVKPPTPEPLYQASISEDGTQILFTHKKDGSVVEHPMPQYFADTHRVHITERGTVLILKAGDNPDIGKLAKDRKSTRDNPIGPAIVLMVRMNGAKTWVPKEIWLKDGIEFSAPAQPEENLLKM